MRECRADITPLGHRQGMSIQAFICLEGEENRVNNVPVLALEFLLTVEQLHFFFGGVSLSCSIVAV